VAASMQKRIDFVCWEMINIHKVTNPINRPANAGEVQGKQDGAMRITHTNERKRRDIIAEVAAF